MAPARPPRRGAGGFTFVELLVALAILSFAFTYAIVHLDGATGPARLASNARQLGSTIEFLRDHAIQASRPMELHVDLDRGQWSSVLPPRPSESDLDRERQEEVIFTDPVSFNRNIRFDGIQLDSRESKSSGEIVITFSPLGEITPNGFMIRIISDEIADREDASFSIEVNGLTGEVSYLPGDAPFEQVVEGASFR